MNRQNHAEDFREAVRLKLMIGQQIYIQETKKHRTIREIRIVGETVTVFYGTPREGGTDEEVISFPLSTVLTGPEGINFLIDHSSGAFVMERKVS